VTKDKVRGKLDAAEVRFVRSVAEYSRTAGKHTYFGEALKMLNLNHFVHYGNKL
jgi:hypothetical protein